MGSWPIFAQAGFFSKLLVLYDRAKLPSPGRCVVALHEGEVVVRKVQGKPPRVSLVATDGVTPPILFGQGSDPEILGVATVGVHHLVD
jgi:SOS-response transcriptional repressor LexA